MKGPVVLRGQSTFRTYQETLNLYKKNRRETGLNRDLQSHYFNVIDKPKLTAAPNDMNNLPIHHWLIIPFLHVVSNI